VARVETRLGHNFDPEPFLVVTLSLDGTPRQDTRISASQ
jgi:hypothetical protein